MKKPYGCEQNSGFTIVELLVVIVVIAILAAITIVSYTGISQRAVASALQSDLSNNSNLLKMYYTDNGHYPPSPLGGNNCTDDSRYCLKSSSGNTLDYTKISDNSFKLASINTSSSTGYYTTDNGSLVNKNVIYLQTGDRASLEAGVTGWSPLQACTSAQSSAEYYHGTKSIALTSTDNTIHLYARNNVTTITTAGSTYTFSYWFKAPVGWTMRLGFYDNVSSWQRSGVFVATGSWQRINYTVTYGVGSSTREIAIYSWTGEHPLGGIVYVDAIQLELGSSLTPF